MAKREVRITEIEILNFIQQLRTPIGDVLMPFFSALGNNGYIWVALMVTLLVLPKTRKAGIILVVALLLEAVSCNLILKPLIMRVRPCDVNTSIQLLVSRPEDYSFPSGHSMAAFAAASAVFFAGFRKASYAVGVLALIIAFSRLYLYVHYPTDVLAGIILGILCGWVASLIVRKIENSHSQKLKENVNLNK